MAGALGYEGPVLTCANKAKYSMKIKGTDSLDFKDAWKVRIRLCSQCCDIIREMTDKMGTLPKDESHAYATVTYKEI